MTRKLFVIFILAFIIKLLAGLFLGVYNSGPEVFEYETITDNILNGKGFLYNFYGVEYRAYVQPFFPILTAIVYYLTNHSQIVMLVIQSIISSLLCFVVYSIAVNFTGRNQALLAAAITSFHPGLTIYSVLKLHPLVFDTLFYLLAIGFILIFIQSPDNRNAILAGFVIGLALLSRSTILVFTVFSLVYVFFILRDIEIKVKLRRIFLICFVALIVYSPWVIRNYNIFNDFVFMQTGSGENLWVGNNREASGSAILVSGESVRSKMPRQMRRELQGLDELGQARYYKNYFANFIKEKPLLFIQLFMKKFYYFWWFAPHTGILYNRSWLYIYKIYYGVLLFLCIIGLVPMLKNRSSTPGVIILFIYMFSLACLHAIVNVDTRHRWAVEPIMIIFSSIGFFNLAGYFKNNLIRSCLKMKI